MVEIKEWYAKIPKNENKASETKSTIDNLFNLIRADLTSSDPHYQDCVEVLASFSHKIVGMFYENLYGKFPTEIQAEWNRAFLEWAERQPLIPKKGSPVFLKMFQAIQYRLNKIETAEELSGELQWYIGHFNDKRATMQTKKLCETVELEHLRKLLQLRVEDWTVNRGYLRQFYSVLFSGFTAETVAADYQLFLKRARLSEPEERADSPAAEKDDDRTAPSQGGQAEQTAETAFPQEKPDRTAQEDVREPQRGPSRTDKDSSALDELPAAVPSVGPPSSDEPPMKAEAAETAVAPAVPQAENVPAENRSAPAAPDHDSGSAKKAGRSKTGGESADRGRTEQDGVKLLRRALAWAEQQTKDSRTREKELEDAEKRVENLEAKKRSLEADLRESRANASDLRIRLERAEQQLVEEQEKYRKLDETVGALHRMNENTEAQAIGGFQADLADALRSVVKDASLPEAQDSAEILGALLGDCLDILRWKGIPLEEE